MNLCLGPWMHAPVRSRRSTDKRTAQKSAKSMSSARKAGQGFTILSNLDSESAEDVNEGNLHGLSFGNKESPLNERKYYKRSERKSTVGLGLLRFPLRIIHHKRPTQMLL